MTRSSVTEEQIVAVLRDPQYTSERQRCFALGITPSGSYAKKFKKLREKYGITEPEPDKRGGRRFGPKDQPGALRADDIRKDDRLMYGKKRLIVLAVDDDGLRLRRMDGSEYRLSWRQFKANAGQYVKVPAGDPQGSPVKTYMIEPGPTDLKTKFEQVAERLQAEAEPAIAPRKPGMTINPEFEAAVQEMEAEHEAKNPKVVDRGNGYSEIVKAEPSPIHIDLEMDDSADSVDYIDPEWGVTRNPVTVPSRREYLDRIDQLLDLVMPDCKAELIFDATVILATRLLGRGIRDEVGGRLVLDDRKIRKEAGA